MRLLNRDFSNQVRELLFYFSILINKDVKPNGRAGTHRAQEKEQHAANELRESLKYSIIIVVLVYMGACMCKCVYVRV